MYLNTELIIHLSYLYIYDINLLEYSNSIITITFNNNNNNQIGSW